MGIDDGTRVGSHLGPGPAVRARRVKFLVRVQARKGREILGIEAKPNPENDETVLDPEVSSTGPKLDTRDLERLLEVGRSLVLEHDPDVVLNDVLEAAREMTGARYAALGVLDADKRELERFLTVGLDAETRRGIGPLPRGKGILGELIRDPRPLRLRRISEHPRSYGFPVNHPPMESFLGVPVVIRGEVFGNLYLSEKEGAEEFTDSDARLLGILAQWAAVAIDNARLLERGQRRRGDLERAMRGLEATVGLSRELGGETDLARVLELIAKRGRALVDARSSAILLVDEDPEKLRVAEVAGQLDRTLIGTEVSEPDSRALGALRAGHSQRYQGSPPAKYAAFGAALFAGLIVPLRSRGVDLGVLSVFDPIDTDDGFTADDELALESLATSAATAIAATRALEDERIRLSIASSERERTRWARELHDDTLQELGALALMQESALHSSDPERMQEALARSSEQVEGIARGLRGLISELRPAALDQLGIEAALEALVDRVRNRSGLAVELDVDLSYERGNEPRRHTPGLEATVYRIAQEALTNVVKHASADNVRVLVEERDERVRVMVEDDGKGFDPAAAHDGFGLLGMGERVEIAGGTIELKPGQGGGTRLTAVLPSVRRSD